MISWANKNHSPGKPGEFQEFKDRNKYLFVPLSTEIVPFKGTWSCVSTSMLVAAAYLGFWRTRTSCVACGTDKGPGGWRIFFRCYFNRWRCPKSLGVAPNHPTYIDHDFVLKAMVTVTMAFNTKSWSKLDNLGLPPKTQVGVSWGSPMT